MAELTIRFDIRFTPGVFRVGLTGLLLSVLATELSSEQLTLTTYYPAPSGVYTNMLTTGNTYLARDGGGATMVGIGTGGPAVKLHVVGDATYAAAFMSGNVGIGTVTPGTKLHIVGVSQNTLAVDSPAYPEITHRVGGAIKSYNAIVTSAGGYFGGSTVDDWIFRNEGAGSIRFGRGGTMDATISNTGRVGIGMPSPQASLDVGPAGGAGIIVARQNNCSPIPYVLGTTPCPGGNYVTNATGIYVNRIQLGSSAGDSEGVMMCCPLPAGGTVTF